MHALLIASIFKGDHKSKLGLLMTPATNSDLLFSFNYFTASLIAKKKKN